MILCPILLKTLLFILIVDIITRFCGADQSFDRWILTDQSASCWLHKTIIDVKSKLQAIADSVRLAFTPAYAAA